MEERQSMKNYNLSEEEIEFVKKMVLFLKDKNEAQARYWCSRLGHPFGVIWYSSGPVLEPDMTCKGCYKDLA